MIFNKLLVLFCLALLHPPNVLTQESFPCLIGENTSSTIFCPQDYSPVCAYGPNCASEQCPGTTVDNACMACYQQGFSYYIQGVCPGDEPQIQQPEEQIIAASIAAATITVACPTINNQIQVSCPGDFNPVCAFSNGDESSRGETVTNACVACNQFGFNYYISGPCPESGGEEELAGEDEFGGEEFSGEGEEFLVEEEEVEFIEENFISRDPGIKIVCPFVTFEQLAAAFCPADNTPVCAFLFSRNQGATVANGCEACNVKGFDYYIQGACPPQLR